MLATAKMKMADPTMTLVLRSLGRGRVERELAEGLIEVPHFNPDHTYEIAKTDYEDEVKYDMTFYGVADTPEQARKYAEEAIGSSPEKFCVFVTHVQKDPSNRGRGGGWRWHKWGEYIGTGTPTMEYLDDEKKFKDGIYVFHIHKLP